MSNIFIPNSSGYNLKKKDCEGFIPLPDGTLTGDPKYCSRSFICRQLGMRSDYVVYTGMARGIENMVECTKFYDNIYDYLCTGMYATEKDIGVDEEAS